jgi:Tol biopolymer transport system component
LNKAVNKLREALEDSAENPKFIETLPRRGYRFIAPVSENGSSEPLGERSLSKAQPISMKGGFRSDPQPGFAASTMAEGRWRGSRNLFKVLLAAAAVLLLVRLTANWLERYRHESRVEPLLVKLTDNRATERVAISPEGRYIVYARRESEGLGLWVRQVAVHGSEVRVLAPEVVYYAGLTFSPDENSIYFVRGAPAGSGVHALYVMPVLGGPAKQLLTSVESSVSFSPNGKRFVFTRYSEQKDSVDVCIAEADGSGRRLLTTLSHASPLHQSGAAWSPDGRTIAVSVMLLGKDVRWALESISVSDGKIQEFYSHPYKIGRPMWLAGGRSLLVALDDQNNQGQLYSLSYPSGQARKITNDLADYDDDRIDLTRDGKVAAILAWDQIGDVWEAPVADFTKAKQLASSGGALMNLAVWPDGRILATGLDNRLWKINANGGERSLFTEIEPASAPFVCGRYVLFLHQTIQGDDSTGIMRAEADGTSVMKLVDARVGTAACAPDGKSVFYDRLDAPQRIERVPIEGGAPTIIKDIPATESEWQIAISPDGKYLSYLYSELNSTKEIGQKVTVMPLEGGLPVKVLNLPGEIWSFRWSPDSSSVQFLNDIFTSNSSNLWQQALHGRGPTQLTRFTSGRIFDFQWSGDGKKLLFIRGDLNGDVVLIKNLW